MRILASEMEKVLGQRISVVNTAGASGAIGMQNAYDAPKDGYTWTGNADVSVVNYPVLDLMKVTHRDWNQWYALMTPNIIAVTADYPAKDLPDLVRMMKEKPGQVAVASAGVGSSGHTALEVFSTVLGVKARHVPYAGGNPAVIATISGESDVVMQLSMEQADMIRAGKLKPLANMSDRPLTISGYGEVPPITKCYPNFPSIGSHFGIMMAKGAPPEVIAAVEQGLRRRGQVRDAGEVRRPEGGLPGEPQGGGGRQEDGRGRLDRDLDALRHRVGQDLTGPVQHPQTQELRRGVLCSCSVLGYFGIWGLGVEEAVNLTRRFI